MKTILITDPVPADAFAVHSLGDGTLLVIESESDYENAPESVRAARDVLAAASQEVVRIVTPRQIRQALTAAGLRAQVEAAVAAADQNTKDWWEFAQQIESNHPVVQAMCHGLGFTDQQIEQVFVLAETL